MTQQTQQIRELAAAEIRRLAAERDRLTGEATEVGGLLAKIRGRGRRSVADRVEDRLREQALHQLDGETTAELAVIANRISELQGHIANADRADQYGHDAEQHAGAVEKFAALVADARDALEYAASLMVQIDTVSGGLSARRDRLAAEREELERRGAADLPEPATHTEHGRRSFDDGLLALWRAGDDLAQWHRQRH